MRLSFSDFFYGEGNGTPAPVLLPGKAHGWRSPVGCHLGGSKELDKIERLHFHFSLSCIGEGNGNPPQCSCLENPRDGGAWWAAVYGVAQSRTRLKRLSSLAATHQNGRVICPLWSFGFSWGDKDSMFLWTVGKTWDKLNSRILRIVLLFNKMFCTYYIQRLQEGKPGQTDVWDNGVLLWYISYLLSQT